MRQVITFILAAIVGAAFGHFIAMGLIKGERQDAVIAAIGLIAFAVAWVI